MCDKHKIHIEPGIWLDKQILEAKKIHYVLDMWEEDLL